MSFPNEIVTNGLIVLIARPFKYSPENSDRNKYGQTFYIIDHVDSSKEKNAKIPQSISSLNNYKNNEQDSHQNDQRAFSELEENFVAPNLRKNLVKLKFLNFRKRFFPF